MKMMLLVAAAVLLVIAPDSCQSSKQEWLPDEMHNPQQDPRNCGHNFNEPAYICDPNGLTGSHLDSINWILKDAAYNSTRCPCSNFYCETYKKPLGYHIGVALVKRMIIQTSLNGRRNTPEDQAQIFAHNLQKKWNLGRCKEDIIIFYSYEDRVLTMHGGSTAMSQLTEPYRNLLAYKVGSRFSEGRIVEALNNLLYDIKLVLNCETPHENNCGVSEIRSGASGVTSYSLLTVLALVILVFCSWRA